MKRVLLFAAIAVGVLAIPSSAAARTDCTYTASQDASNTTKVGAVTVVVYADATGSNGGVTGTADAAAGACADGINTADFDGGYVEAGASDAGQGYAVIDGDDANNVTGQEDGYAALSNYESGTSRDASCDDPDPLEDGPDQGQAGSSNSGGCTGFDPSVPVVGGTYAEIPLIACGNTSGEDFASTSRDGCSIP